MQEKKKELNNKLKDKRFLFPQKFSTLKKTFETKVMKKTLLVFYCLFKKFKQMCKNDTQCRIFLFVLQK